MEGQVIENAVQETVQETVDKVNSNWDQIKAYFNGHIPDLISFGMKVVLSIVAFYVGTKLIKWLLKVAKRSMEKAGIDMGVAQFICSFGKFLLYLILIFNIATNFGVKESSVAALLGTIEKCVSEQRFVECQFIEDHAQRFSGPVRPFRDGRQRSAFRIAGESFARDVIRFVVDDSPVCGRPARHQRQGIREQVVRSPSPVTFVSRLVGAGRCERIDRIPAHIQVSG